MQEEFDFSQAQITNYNLCAMEVKGTLQYHAQQNTSSTCYDEMYSYMQDYLTSSDFEQLKAVAFEPDAPYAGAEKGYSETGEQDFWCSNQKTSPEGCILDLSATAALVSDTLPNDLQNITMQHPFFDEENSTQENGEAHQLHNPCLQPIFAETMYFNTQTAPLPPIGSQSPTTSDSHSDSSTPLHSPLSDSFFASCMAKKSSSGKPRRKSKYSLTVINFDMLLLAGSFIKLLAFITR